MRTLTFGEAKVEALGNALKADPRVMLFGAGFFGLGHLHLTRELTQQFSDRILPCPISENGVTGAVIGAALAGAKPILAYATASFSLPAFLQLTLEAANVYYMSAGQVKCPAIFHMLVGIRIAGAAQHSARPQAQYLQAPGLQIVAPSTPTDFLAMLPTVQATERPTIWIDHTLLTDIPGEIPDTLPEVPVGKAEVKRQGKDVTLVAYSITLPRALAAAEKLAGEGIDVEVVDLRTLAPLDYETVLHSVAKTGRLVVADETPTSCSVASEVVASVAEEGLANLRRVKRAAMPNVPIPMNSGMETFITVTEDRIADAVRSVTS